MDRAVGALRGAGIPSRMRFTSVGESGGELVGLLNGSSDGKIGGEAILRIDDRCPIFRYWADCIHSLPIL